MSLFTIKVVITVDPALVSLVEDILARVDEIITLSGDKAAEATLTAHVKDKTATLSAAVAAASPLST